MARKNLLGDSDYAKGWDNRFGCTVHIGFVSKIEVNENQANVRVIMPDKVDHKNTPLNTKPIPVLQVASTAKKSFAMPRVGTPVAIIKMANSTSDYLVVGSFYSKRYPPPVTDPMLDYTIWDDGSTQQFNASNGTLTWKLKGNVEWDNEGGATLLFDQDVLIQTDGNVAIKPTGTALIEAATVHLKGNIVLEGNITHTGDMTTSGVHQDSLGFHTGALAPRSAQDLEARIAALETRVEELENRGGPRL